MLHAMRCNNCWCERIPCPIWPRSNRMPKAFATARWVWSAKNASRWHPCMPSPRRCCQTLTSRNLTSHTTPVWPTSTPSTIYADSSPARREQLKLEAALGKTLIAIVRFLLCSGSSRFRHFSHFQVSVEHSNPNLNEQVCPFIGPAHLPLFCAPQAHHFIDCRFGDTAADGHATPIPPSVIDKVFVIRFQVPIRPAKIPP